MPVGDGASYTMMRLDGKDVAAISAQPQQQRDAGVPPTWNSYVSVEDADETAEKAALLDVGRMAVIQDPQGAYFLIWQPRQHFGAALVNAPGAFCWNELSSPDLDAAKEFYAELFGWSVSPFEQSPEPYLVIINGGTGNGGMRELNQPGMPPNWLVYFAVDDIDAGLAKVEELGGAILAGPIDIGIAKVGVVQDPQGATFAIYAGELEP
jgi:predicted enzyme related to lactoylglutathione lyase